MAGEVGDMSFSMTLMDSEMAVMKLSFSLSVSLICVAYMILSGMYCSCACVFLPVHVNNAECITFNLYFRMV